MESSFTLKNLALNPNLLTSNLKGLSPEQISIKIAQRTAEMLLDFHKTETQARTEQKRWLEATLASHKTFLDEIGAALKEALDQIGHLLNGERPEAKTTLDEIIAAIQDLETRMTALETTHRSRHTP